MASYDPNDPHPDEIPAFKYPPNSHYGREMRKWDRKKRDGGMNADGFERFPMMVHKAHQLHEGGKWMTALPEPDISGFDTDNAWDRACKSAARFTLSCQRIVQDEREYLKARDEGWQETPDLAMAWRQKLEDEISEAAAARVISERKMSPAAQAEAAAADAATPEHLAEIPVARRGRRPAN